MIAASNSWVISFDNLSGIPPWLSDALCRLSTGGGFAIRELHTDNEEILFDATRPIILNGIDDIAGNADLADRSIIVTLPQVAEEDRIPETIFWRDFKLAQARIIGGLLDAVSMALRNLEHVNVPRLPRMADFARWICAAAPALPFNQEEFLQAYSDNRRESVSLSIEASQVATSIQTLLAAPGEWEGTATELLQALSGKVPDEILKTGRVDERHQHDLAAILGELDGRTPRPIDGERWRRLRRWLAGGREGGKAEHNDKDSTHGHRHLLYYRSYSTRFRGLHGALRPAVPKSAFADHRRPLLEAPSRPGSLSSRAPPLPHRARGPGDGRFAAARGRSRW